MRCIIFIALCVALASANLSQYRFKNLLNQYQQQTPYGQWQDLDNFDNVYGNNFDNVYGNNFDNVYGDNFNIYKHFDDINQGLLNIEQCPVMQNVLNQVDVNDYDDVFTGNYLNNQQGQLYNELYDNQQGQLYNQFYDNEQGQLYNQQGQLYSNGIETIKEIHDANVKLASKLYKQTKEDKDDKNTVVSPISIQLALAALNQGARGNTKLQINRVTGGKTNKQVQAQVFKALAHQLKKGQFNTNNVFGQSTKINPVTIIAINKRTPAQQWFVQTVRNQPGAQIKHCNFQNQPQQCRQMINSLVSQKTNMKINQIVPRDAITDNTKMVLVNALEMKAKWGRQMRNHVTKEAKFYPLDTNKVKIVEVMETVGQFKHYEDELVKIVGIPTQQKELTMYVIVPKYKDGLTAVEKLHLQDGEQLKQLLKKTDLHTRQVGVQLPKFQIKHKIDARRTLQKQGVTDAFDALRADFSGITGVSKNGIIEVEDELNNLGLDNDNTFGLDNVFQNQYGLLQDNVVGLGDKKPHLNKFIHQATIKVTENGITAATQSENQYDVLNKYQQNVNFNQLGNGLDMDQMNTWDDVSGLFQGNVMGKKMVKANRAFAFVVKHNPTNQLVLVGRVIDAAQKNVNNAFQTINNVDQL